MEQSIHDPFHEPKAIKINLPETDMPRVVIIGGGFAGLTLARRLARMKCQVVLIDKNNFHQFQPLFYQVAMSGLEPSSIAFPLRKLFQKRRNVFLRVTEVAAIDTEKKHLRTPLGIVNYHYLVIATGADTNFFGNKEIERKAIPMKSVAEALYLRNQILDHYEKALTTTDYDLRQGFIDIVIVGGGPTGVEVAGALAEMKQYVIPKDYPELDYMEIDIHLVQSGDRLLPTMSEAASRKALKFLQDLGVKVRLKTRVTGYDGKFAYLDDGSAIRTLKVIWAAGIRCRTLEGLPAGSVTNGNRLKVNRFNQLEGFDDIFAIGDIAFMTETQYPDGHPQVAQAAIQQAKQLSKNFGNLLGRRPLTPFNYRDKGSMATIGRNKAVVDLPSFRFQGAFAWFVWLFVHLFQILGVRNKIVVFLNWLWNYFTYDQSLRLIIRPRVVREPESDRGSGRSGDRESGRSGEWVK